MVKSSSSFIVPGSFSVCSTFRLVTVSLSFGVISVVGSGTILSCSCCLFFWYSTASCPCKTVLRCPLIRLPSNLALMFIKLVFSVSIIKSTHLFSSFSVGESMRAWLTDKSGGRMLREGISIELSKKTYFSLSVS